MIRDNSSFHSEDIKIFILAFWSRQNTANQKDQAHFKIYDAAIWEANNCNSLTA